VLSEDASEASLREFWRTAVSHGGQNSPLSHPKFGRLGSEQDWAAGPIDL
jgi:hypothetical protein